MSRRWIILLGILGLCGCAGLAYQRLDLLIPWYIGRYVDLDRPQRAALDAALEPQLAWHRREELPRYRDLLQRIGADSAQRLTAADVESWADEASEAWERVEARALDLLLKLGAQLDDQQIEDFLNTLQSRQREYEKKYLQRSEQRYRRDSEKALRKNLQRFLGRLSSEQRERTQQAAGALQRSDQLWLRERAAWLERLSAALERAPDWQDQIRTLAKERKRYLSADYQAMVEHNSQQLCAATADVLNQRSPAQQRKWQRELERWQRRFDGLHDQ